MNKRLVTVMIRRSDVSPLVFMALGLVMALIIEFVIDPFMEAGPRSRSDISGWPMEHFFFILFLAATIFLIASKIRKNRIVVSLECVIDQSVSPRIGQFSWESVQQVIVKPGRIGWICFRAKPESELEKLLADHRRRWKWLLKLGQITPVYSEPLFCFNRAVVTEELAEKVTSLAESHGIDIVVLRKQATT